MVLCEVETNKLGGNKSKSTRLIRDDIEAKLLVQIKPPFYSTEMKKSFSDYNRDRMKYPFHSAIHVHSKLWPSG